MLLFFGEILAHMLVLEASWYFGVELVTFVVQRTELCRLTVAVLETPQRLKRRAPGSKYLTTVATWLSMW